MYIYNSVYKIIVRCTFLTNPGVKSRTKRAIVSFKYFRQSVGLSGHVGF